jgi:hypothetical protein|tara:strand:+ start:184 stop:1074 length:891 start_codon:yes stop_codon:yes gene_type:complete
MSKYIFEALDSKEDKLRTAKEKLEDQRKELWNSQDKEMRDILVSYFEGTEGIETNLEDLDYRGSVDYITISCKGDEFEKEVWNEEKEDYEKVIKHRSYELCTIYTTTERNKEDEKEYVNIGIGTYSTSDHYSDRNLERFMFNGQIAMTINDFKDDILADLNTCKKKYSVKETKLTDKIIKHRREIEEVRTDRDNYKRDNMISDLKKGIEITREDGLSLQVRYDWYVSGIKKAKIVHMSYSGKSCSLKVEKIVRRWNSETDKYENHTTEDVLDKIRISKLEDALIGSYNSHNWTVDA